MNRHSGRAGQVPTLLGPGVTGTGRLFIGWVSAEYHAHGFGGHTSRLQSCWSHSLTEISSLVFNVPSVLESFSEKWGQEELLGVLCVLEQTMELRHYHEVGHSR